MIASGELDRRISIEVPTVTRSALNNPVSGWGSLADVWAKKTDVSDGERVAAQEAGAEISTRFLIRWSLSVSQVDAKYRLKCEGRTYEITAVKEIGRREGLELTTIARAENA